MKAKKCPECKSSVAVDAEHCPNCPHSFQGADDGVQSRRYGKNFTKPLIMIAAALAAAYFVWQGLSFVMRFAGDQGGGQDGEEFELFGEVLRENKRVDRGRGADAVRSRAVLGRRPYSTQREEPVSVARTSKSGPARIQSPLDDDARPTKEWRLRGVVYDLVTLKPVARATIVLKDPQLNRRFETMTDEKGRYRAVVAPLYRRGYSVVILHSSYALSYLKARDASIAKKSETERRRLALELTRALDGPATVSAPGHEPHLTDFYLAPLKR